MTETSLTINGSQAALHYDALAAAALAIEKRMKLQAALPFKRGLALELAAYRAEMMRLATAFPTVDVAAPK
jgi:hypothetical protein